MAFQTPFADGRIKPYPEFYLVLVRDTPGSTKSDTKGQYHPYMTRKEKLLVSVRLPHPFML